MKSFFNLKVFLRNVMTLVLLMGIMAGCGLPENEVLKEERGTITFSLALGSTRTIEPDIDMTEASYLIMGQGPQGNTAQVTATDPSVTISDLCVGTWDFTVYALNSDGIRIYTGNTTIDVYANADIPVTVTLLPLTGAGTLNLDVTWNPDTEISILTELVPFSGPSLTDLFVNPLSSGAASYQNTTLEAGYYTLIIRVEVDGIIYAGCAEVVRIVSGADTNALFEFDLTGNSGFTINITPNNPLEITLSGIVDAIVLTDTMYVTAEAPPEAGNVSFVWFLDGDTIGTGPTIEVTPTTPGDHVLSVTAFSVNGEQGGCTTHTFNAGYDIPPVMHTINAIANNGGSITPSGDVDVERGTDIDFEIAAGDAYRISFIIIDETTPVAEVYGIKTYTHAFTNVMTDHSIEVFFEHWEQELTVQGSGPGTATPPGPALYDADIPVEITATPDNQWVTFEGWSIVSGDAVIADPAALTTTVTLNDQDAIIRANFVHYSYTITWTERPTEVLLGIGIIHEDTVRVGDSITITTSSQPSPIQLPFNHWTVNSGGSNIIIANPAAATTTVQLIGHGNANIAPSYLP